MINKDELKNKLTAIILKNLQEAKTDTEAYSKSFQQYSKYLLSHYNEFTQDAKEVADNQVDFYLKEARISLDNMPDGIKKRDILRILDKADGHHFDIEQLLGLLDKKTSVSHPIISATESLFMKISQVILDWLHDITQHTLKFPDLAILSLFYSAVDELIVAFHLAQHSYAPQSFSHNRAVFEILDKISLFHSQPKWLNLWASEKKEDEKKKFEEFKPSAVRKKLNKNRYDPIYGLFSEIGVHITFKYIQSKVFVAIESKSKERKNAKINVGGTPRVDALIWSNTACVYTLIGILPRIVEVYKSFLLEEEAIKQLVESFNEFAEYNLNNFIPWAKSENLPTSEMEDFLKKFPSSEAEVLESIRAFQGFKS